MTEAVPWNVVAVTSACEVLELSGSCLGESQKMLGIKYAASRMRQ